MYYISLSCETVWPMIGHLTQCVHQRKIRPALQATVRQRVLWPLQTTALLVGVRTIMYGLNGISTIISPNAHGITEHLRRAEFLCIITHDLTKSRNLDALAAGFPSTAKKRAALSGMKMGHSHPLSNLLARG